MAEFGNGLTEESLLDSDPGHPELEDPGVGDEEPGLEEGEAAIEDPELEAIKARVREMEEEAEKLKELQNEVEKQMNLSPPPVGPVIMSIEEKMEADGRSIYVGNVDYGATAEELEAHFHGCGSVNRVTILCDKYTGHPKGFAYIEFADKESVRTAMALDESLFRGRQIKSSAVGPYFCSKAMCGVSPQTRCLKLVIMSLNHFAVNFKLELHSSRR
ncbi:hypothetical protein F2P81_019338 [Scophthalmus maximus]|uniref:RRM domain-containing protein n=1 Tax=Scophthalmus maximus TaxID=52904 RepID=A0A6A4SAY4_SCOMX|nr:hypothetical protein F2P81_019338 [Scophthalmus maximus]